MSEIRELYQEAILDHSRRPRNFGRLESFNRMAEGYNPLCGDQIKVYLEVTDGIVRNASFEGSGCAISTASASLMTEMIKTKSENEINDLFESFHSLVTGGPSRVELLGKLVVFSGVSEFPARVKCASLAWHTIKNAIQGEKMITSTE